MNTTTPLISIIIPVYNNEKYLPYAIKSVINQGYDDYEIIIVDDGSTDSTPEIADDFAVMNNKIKVIHQRNQWIYASFNNGIKEATGKYIYILNSDDRLESNSLQRMAEFVLKTPVDVLWTNVDIYSYDKRLDMPINGIPMENFQCDEYIDDINEIHRLWPEMYFNDQVTNQANLYKREIALKHPFRTDMFAGDLIFNMSIANDIRSMGILSGNTYKFIDYNTDSMNASIGKYYANEREMWDIIYKGYMSLFNKWKLDPKIFSDQLKMSRMRNITHEIRSLDSRNCQMNIDEKITTVFTRIATLDIKRISEECGCLEEFEARVLSGVSELINGYNIEDIAEDQFIVNLLNALLSFEHNDSNLCTVKKSINDPNNVCSIGSTFYNTIINDNSVKSKQ